MGYATFSYRPDGGNSAGIVLDATDLTADRMLAIVVDVGYSEIAFLRPRVAGGTDTRILASGISVRRSRCRSAAMRPSPRGAQY